MFIYKITNKINGKMYIGFDFKDSQYESCHRWTHHQRVYNQPGLEYDKYLYRAMRKYQIENFEYEIIDRSAENIEELADLEIYYIKEFGSLVPNGYNMKEGGQGGSLKLENYSEEEQIKRRKRFSEGQRKRFDNLTEEEWKIFGEKSRKLREKLWKVESPTGEIFIVKGLKRFCQENDLNYDKMFSSKRNNRKVDGWLVTLV